jgi:hypothetical protein
MDRKQIVELLARKPLMLSILKIISASEAGETPSSAAMKLNKLTPNVARMTSQMRRMGILTSKRTGKMKVYTVPKAKHDEVKAIIDEAVASTVSDARSRLTESFYQNLLYSSLSHSVPQGWRVSANPKLKSDDSMLSLDLSLTDDTGQVTGVELNMGPPGQHLYALIGRSLVGVGDAFKMVILVLLTTHAKNYRFLERIRSVNSQPRFGVVLREMPAESETALANGVAKEIVDTIRNPR